MKILTQKEETIGRLVNLPATETITLVAQTSKKPLKKPRKAETTDVTIPNSFRNGVSKKTVVTLKSGNYQNLVNESRKKKSLDPDFESKGTYCVPLDEADMVMVHKEDKDLPLDEARIYIRTMHRKSSDNNSIGMMIGDDTATSVSIFLDSDGNEITKEEYFDAIRKYCSGYTKPEVKTKNASDRQGLDNPYHVNNWGFGNVKSVIIDGKPVYSTLSKEETEELAARM